MTHLSDLELDAHRLGTAPPQVCAHLEVCTMCQARAQALAEDATAFAVRFDPAVLATSTLQAVPAPRPRWWRGAAGAFAALAAAAGLLLFVRPDPEAVRAKGSSARVELFVTDGGQIRPARGPVDPRAHLALRVRTATRAHIRLLWSSTPGVWQPLHPAAEASPWVVSGEAFLPRQLVLDGALEPERLGVVLCPGALVHSLAQDMLEHGASAGCEVEVVEVRKRTPGGAP